MIKRDPRNALNVPGMLEKGQQNGLPVATHTFISLLLGPAWSEDRSQPTQKAVRTEVGVGSPSRECS